MGDEEPEKPKFPYLRKGEGIRKYGAMQPRVQSATDLNNRRRNRQESQADSAHPSPSTRIHSSYPNTPFAIFLH